MPTKPPPGPDNPADPMPVGSPQNAASGARPTLEAGQAPAPAAPSTAGSPRQAAMTDQASPQPGPADGAIPAAAQRPSAEPWDDALVPEPWEPGPWDEPWP